MKIPLFFLSMILLWLGAALAPAQSADDLSAAPRARVVDLAQATPPQSQPPGVDPFIKDRAKEGTRSPRVAPVGSSGSGPDAPPTEAPIVLTLVYELFSMDQETLLSVLNAHADGPQRYAHVLQLLADNKAGLENLTAITTRSGQRCNLGSRHEFRYPTQFSAPDTATQISRPVSFETRHLGDSIECEPTLGVDGETVDLTIAVTNTQFSRWVESGLSQGGTISAQPIFTSRQLNTQRTLTVGKPCCLGTLSRPGVPTADGPPAASASASLAFLTVKIPSPEERRTTPLAEEDLPSTLDITYTFYSMERAAAREVLTSHSAFAAYERIAPMIESGTVRLERVLELPTRSGQRSKAEEVEEITYPTDFTAPTFAGAVPGAHAVTNFETRNTGCTIEQEPTLSRGAEFCDLTVAPEFVREVNYGAPSGVTDLWPKLPVFEARTLSTSLSAVRDRPTFVGTFNFPRDTGLVGSQDDGRVWLGFVKASSPPR